jgi:RNA polymerase sigma-70 factor (ECF subfamily)
LLLELLREAGLTLPSDHDISRFEALVLAHLDSAYNLARWMVRSEHDAQDVVQEACLRALRSFDTFRGGDARCWLLAIVRNTCCTWLDRNRRGEPESLMEEDLEEFASEDGDPQRQLIRQADAEEVRRAIDALPAAYREMVVLRELEGLSYKEIAGVAGVPIGTVMSRLARARKQLEERLGAADRGGSLKEV